MLMVENEDKDTQEDEIGNYTAIDICIRNGVT